MLKIVSREYKVVLDHQMFARRGQAVSEFWEELSHFARPLGVRCSGEFGKPKRRRIVFLDTIDHTVLGNRLVFRRRSEADGTEYTLKCRSPDRYFAADADLSAARRLKAEAKFEEDIAAPFSSRFSHSNTVKAEIEQPQTLKDAAAMFPAFRRLLRDGRKCPLETKLEPVNALEAFERVFTGPTLKLGKEPAVAAVILWSSAPKGRPLVAEFSFRYADKREAFSRSVAEPAMNFFLAIQRLDWCRPEGMTKTQYVYRST